VSVYVCVYVGGCICAWVWLWVWMWPLWLHTIALFIHTKFHWSDAMAINNFITQSCMETIYIEGSDNSIDMQMWKANWAITDLCQNEHPRQQSFSLLAGFNLADFMMVGLSASTVSLPDPNKEGHMETQFSVCQLSSTASNSPLSPHSHGVPASFRSDTCTILSSHTGMATGLDVQPGLQYIHSHIPHWLPPAHTYDSPLLHMHVTSCTATTVEGNNGYHQEHKFSQPQYFSRQQILSATA